MRLHSALGHIAQMEFKVSDRIRLRFPLMLLSPVLRRSIAKPSKFVKHLSVANRFKHN